MSNQLNHITLHGIEIPVIGVYCDHAIRSDLFRQWIARIDLSEFRITSLDIKSVRFTQRNGVQHIIFILLEVNMGDAHGQAVSRTIFLRGPAVGMLIVLSCEGKEYTVLTSQARIPIGLRTPEIAAGMLDGSGDFVGAAAREIEEEVGMKISSEKLVDLTEWAFSGMWPGAFPSAGACDEFIRLFLFEGEISREKLDELNGRLAGLAEQHEYITVSVIPLEELPRSTPDMKALSAYCLYEARKKSLVSVS